MSSTTPPSLARRAGRWALRGLGALVALVVVIVACAYVLSERRLARTYATHDYPLTLSTDSATIAHGARVATLRGCRGCHGDNLAGTVMIDDPMFGRIVTANLTRGGRGASLTPADWERAVRHGLRRDGTSLLVMPAYEFASLTDDDVAAIASYAATLKPVTTSLPSDRVGPLARVLMSIGKLDAATPAAMVRPTAHVRSIVVEPTAKYGEYLVASCRGCHGETLSGGMRPGPPSRPARNITPDSATGIGTWSEADFARVLRTGRLPDGTMLDTTEMPVPVTRQFDDVEVQAIYAYLRTVPAKPYGNR